VLKCRIENVSLSPLITHLLRYRFMQAIGGMALDGDYKIDQNSCLHGSLNLKSLLKKGNGMSHKWNTSNAYMKKEGVPDFGACTVPQLLLGYDANLASQNANDYYTNDGRNPCFESDDYFEYITGVLEAHPPRYDYVVLNDQTKRPGISAKRNTTLQVLQDYYVPLLLETGAVPVFFATHGYESDEVDVSDMGNVSEFTSSIFEGYRLYAELLEANLPETQRPRIAPIGLAFLLVYEESPLMWEKLFFVDGFHPSPHGTYLMGCVLHATLYGYMPGHEALPAMPETLWNRARSMQIGGEYHMPFPTYEETVYLYSVARKVMMYDERPKTWIRHYDDDYESDYIGVRG